MINKEHIDNYCISNSLLESENLKEIREYTYKNEDDYDYEINHLLKDMDLIINFYNFQEFHYIKLKVQIY